jgi:hypothetical protein
MSLFRMLILSSVDEERAVPTIVMHVNSCARIVCARLSMPPQIPTLSASHLSDQQLPLQYTALRLSQPNSSYRYSGQQQDEAPCIPDTTPLERPHGTRSLRRFELDSLTRPGTYSS